MEIKQPKSFGHKKELVIALVNLSLALISVFVFEWWFNQVSQLDSTKMIENFGVIFLAVSTLFVAKTYYGKGTMNNIKRVLITVGLASTTLGLLAYSIEVPSDIFFPLSGIALVLVVFYMLSLSLSTLNLTGIIGISMVFLGSIVYLLKIDQIDWSMAGTMTKWTAFIILFIGGVWPHFRKGLHGITGVNKDGSGFSGNEGDEGDGDGDTGDE